MSQKTILLIILFIWGFPSTFFRSKFRKIIYDTNDWKINIKPVFFKEFKGLLFNILPNNKKYLEVRNYYRLYLLVYLILFLSYTLIK